MDKSLIQDIILYAGVTILVTVTPYVSMALVEMACKALGIGVAIYGPLCIIVGLVVALVLCTLIIWNMVK